MSEVVRVCELAAQLRGVSYGKSDASSTPPPRLVPGICLCSEQETLRKTA